MPPTVQAISPSDTSVMSALLSDQFTQKLETLAQAKAEEYKANQPYPHIYFDNFLPVEVAEAALRDFPEPKEVDWHCVQGCESTQKTGLRCSGETASIDPGCTLLPQYTPHAQVSRDADRDSKCVARPTTMLAEDCTRSGPEDFWKCTPTSAITKDFAWTAA